MALKAAFHNEVDLANGQKRIGVGVETETGELRRLGETRKRRRLANSEITRFARVGCGEACGGEVFQTACSRTLCGAGAHIDGAARFANPAFIRKRLINKRRELAHRAAQGRLASSSFGAPEIKARVPSTGSRTQRHDASAARAPNSSPKTP